MLIWGFRNYVKQLAIVMFVCQRCGNPAAQRVVERVRKFTLFFIPLFPVSRRHLVTCTFCGATTQIPAELSAQYVAHAQAGPAPVEQPAMQNLPPAQ